MSSNLQDHITMQTFRESLRIAKTRSSTSPNVSLTVVKDMPIPDPSNPFGIGTTAPVISQSAGVWSNDLQADLDIRDNERPKVDFIINGVQRTYYTGIFVDRNAGNGYVRKKETNFENLPVRCFADDTETSLAPASGPVWSWIQVREGELRIGDYIDPDNDNKDEIVVKTDPFDVEEDENIDRYWYVDMQGGDIDLTVDPEEGPAQGIQSDYDKDVQMSATITKNESPSGVATNRQASATETIRRIIKTRGGDQTVSSSVSQTQSSSWNTGW